MNPNTFHSESGEGLESTLTCGNEDKKTDDVWIQTSVLATTGVP